jgi:hypothetical protein
MWPTRFASQSNAKIKEPNALALSLHRNSEAIANNVYAIEWVMDQLKVVMVTTQRIRSYSINWRTINQSFRIC